MNNRRAVVIGDANVDLVLPIPKQDSSRKEPAKLLPQMYGGGSAANTAVALARLGVEVDFVGSIGTDSYGRWVVDDLQNEGVNTQNLRMVADCFTTIVIAVIEPLGERHLSPWPQIDGAHLQLTADSINPEVIQSAGWVHTTGICLRGSPARETILEVMRQAREAGTTVSLDLNLRLETWSLDPETRQIFQEAISLADVVLGNATEEILPYTGGNSIESTAEQFFANGQTLVARQGSKGAIVASAGQLVHIPAFKVDVIDTLGAGDAFCGGYISAALEGSDPWKAARWGHAVAGLKIKQPGARGLPSRKEVIEFLEKNSTATKM